MSVQEMAETCPSEAQITSSWAGSSLPRLSICCATYNHGKYVEKAIQGFLAQETNFPFEVIIRDDASTDDTGSILKRYKERYPNIIRIISESENRFKKGIRPIHVWPEVVRGEFVALCEGDDFWTDTLKLQKQVELLDRHPSAVMSVAKTNKCLDDNGKLVYVSTFGGSGRTLQGFEEIKKTYFHTSTYVIRAEIFRSVVTQYFKGHCLFGDTALRFLLIAEGEFVFLPEVVSVYRVTGQGVWSSFNRERHLQWEIDATRRLVDFLKGNYKLYHSYRISKLKWKLYKLRLSFMSDEYWNTIKIGIFFKLITCWISYRFKKHIYPRVY